MNLRTLKKLSKRAAPLLKALGDDREQFPAERGENYHGCLVSQRKHWIRRRCHPSSTARVDWVAPGGADIVVVTRAGRRILMRPPIHPRKGTIMVGCMSGHYEPEWDEESAWRALETHVLGHFVDWDGDDLVPTRTFRNSHEIIQGARDIIKEMQNAEQ